MKTYRLEITNSLYIFLSLGIYFLVLDLVEYSDIVFLRFFNAIIVAFFINRTIKQNVIKGQFNYLSNLGSGIITAVFGVLLSVLGLTFYLVALKGVEHLPNLATSVIVMNSNVGLGAYSAALLIEGIASSVVLTFIIMQSWKSIEEFKSA